jgi:hypothetical protein
VPGPPLQAGVRFWMALAGQRRVSAGAPGVLDDEREVSDADVVAVPGARLGWWRRVWWRVP